MSIRENPELAELLADREAPCLSLYQPTHRRHPDNQQDPIRFKNLVKDLEESLKKNHPNVERRAILSHFHALADDAALWNHTLDGLAVFGSHNYFRVFKLQRPVAEIAVVADSFHTKPLIRILQSADRFQVLALTRKAFRMFEGNRDVLDEIHPSQAVSQSLLDPLSDEPSDTHETSVPKSEARSAHQGSLDKSDKNDDDTIRFFRAVDRAILKHLSKPSGLPLILATLSEHQTPFRELSHNPHLLKEGIDINPESLSAEDLREHAWKIEEHHYLALLAALVEEFGQAESKWQGSGDISDIADAAIAGRVKSLIIEADREVPGRIDRATGRISFEKLAHPEVDDLLDDLSEAVLRQGGQVVVVPAPLMPTKSGAAAIYRF